MSVIKRQVLDDQERGFAEGAADARALLAIAKKAPDYREGVLSFIERRSPRFGGIGTHDDRG
jgi:enoyl-CoA hydratase/carnithine racemase